jgi:hypothetical protein
MVDIDRMVIHFETDLINFELNYILRLYLVNILVIVVMDPF